LTLPLGTLSKGRPRIHRMLDLIARQIAWGHDTALSNGLLDTMRATLNIMIAYKAEIVAERRRVGAGD
jgi:hypothetical protein